MLRRLAHRWCVAAAMRASASRIRVAASRHAADLRCDRSGTEEGHLVDDELPGRLARLACASSLRPTRYHRCGTADTPCRPKLNAIRRALAAAVGVGAVHDAAHGHLVLGARLLHTVHLP